MIVRDTYCTRCGKSNFITFCKNCDDNPREEIELLKERISHLEKRNFKLSCLENAGVDNWDGYSYAMDEYNKEEED